MRILLTGGCGYIGSVLVPKLLALGHQVRVVDLQWFGNFLEPHRNLTVDKADFRSVTSMPEDDAVIHLAAVANDPQGELSPSLTWETNALGTMKLAETAARWGVKQFLYASSGSVYGVSTDPEVTENSRLDPISDYNKTKMVAERCVLSYGEMAVQILRPGTVCGFSPRMRLDVTVNRHTMEALSKRVITVLGGEQMRPHVHMQDMCDAYLWLLYRPELTGIFNCGFENISVAEVAHRIADRIDCRIKSRPSNDPRSYRLNSKKLLDTGFVPKRSVDEAIEQLAEIYHAGNLRYDDKWINLKLTPH